jgi:hypothetical protein
MPGAPRRISSVATLVHVWILGAAHRRQRKSVAYRVKFMSWAVSPRADMGDPLSLLFRALVRNFATVG